MNNKIILILNEKNFREDWDVYWFNDLIRCLYNNFNLIYSSPHAYNDDYYINNYGKKPDFIIGYEANYYPNVSGKKILITEDLHHCSLELYKDLFSKVDIILPRFNIINNLFPSSFSDKIIPFPLYCSDIFLSEKINFNSKNKIILYGNLALPHYSERYKWHNFFVEKYNNKFSYIRDTSENTSKIMNNYSFGFCCGYIPISFRDNTNNGYLIAKFFEIPGNGLLLLANTYGVEDEISSCGFVDMVNYINVSFNNIDEVINYIFNTDNFNKINEIRKNGYELVKQNHLINNRIEIIKNIFNK